MTVLGGSWIPEVNDQDYNIYELYKNDNIYIGKDEN